MNGTLYISFFEGQLESALEQVVQLAVREITGTVGASLSSMLLETARKEQDIQRLRATIQSRKPAEKERAESAEQHAAERSSQPVRISESLRLEQKRRAVGQLKLVMERVLEFAVCELSKVVEDSFDDVLLELRKTEQEHEELLEKLRNTAEENGDGDREMEENRNRMGPKQEDLPSGSSEGTKDKERVDDEERGSELSSNESAPPAVISVSQDWVPVLNKVFGQKWCGDVWPVKDAGDVKPERARLCSGDSAQEDAAPPRSVDGQADPPQWLHHTEAGGFDTQQTSVGSTVGDDGQLKSPSMLHRLLTLPTQLLDGDDESMESEDSLVNAVISSHMAQKEKTDEEVEQEERRRKEEDEDEEEEGEETTKRTAAKGGRKVHTCKICGKKFSRAHLLKTHRQTHKEAVRSPFSKLHTHVRTNSGKTT